MGTELQITQLHVYIVVNALQSVNLYGICHNSKRERERERERERKRERVNAYTQGITSEDTVYYYYKALLYCR